MVGSSTESHGEFGWAMPKHVLITIDNTFMAQFYIRGGFVTVVYA